MAERLDSAFPFAAKVTFVMLAVAFIGCAVAIVRQQQEINKLRNDFAPCSQTSYWVQLPNGNYRLHRATGCVAIPLSVSLNAR